MKVTSITVKGIEQPILLPAGAADGGLQISRSFIIEGSTRGLNESHEVDLNDDNLLELTFEDGTVWLCSPSTLDEVFPEAATPSRSITGPFEVPVTLRNDNNERGILGDISLKMLNVFTKPIIHQEVGKLAAELEKKQLDNLSGLY